LKEGKNPTIKKGEIDNNNKLPIDKPNFGCFLFSSIILKIDRNTRNSNDGVKNAEAVAKIDSIDLSLFSRYPVVAIIVL